MRSGDSPGLAQVLGEPLVPGDKIAITGRASPKTLIFLQVKLGSRRYVLRLVYSSLGPQGTKRILQIKKLRGEPVVTLDQRRIDATRVVSP
jgi:hypothetical protein